MFSPLQVNQWACVFLLERIPPEPFAVGDYPFFASSSEPTPAGAVVTRGAQTIAVQTATLTCYGDCGGGRLTITRLDAERIEGRVSGKFTDQLQRMKDASCAFSAAWDLYRP
jgi:hypothetical protein